MMAAQDSTPAPETCNSPDQIRESMECRRSLAHEWIARDGNPGLFRQTYNLLFHSRAYGNIVYRGYTRTVFPYSLLKNLIPCQEPVRIGVMATQNSNDNTDDSGSKQAVNKRAQLKGIL